MSKHALPEWVGWLELVVSVILIFPSFTIMYESNNAQIWTTKVNQLGIVYAVGTLFYAFAGWVIIFALMALGIQTIRNRDSHA